jgi:hypothetical protein
LAQHLRDFVSHQVILTLLFTPNRVSPNAVGFVRIIAQAVRAEDLRNEAGAFGLGESDVIDSKSGRIRSYLGRKQIAAVHGPSIKLPEKAWIACEHLPWRDLCATHAPRHSEREEGHLSPSNHVVPPSHRE